MRKNSSEVNKTSEVSASYNMMPHPRPPLPSYFARFYSKPNIMEENRNKPVSSFGQISKQKEFQLNSKATSFNNINFRTSNKEQFLQTGDQLNVLTYPLPYSHNYYFHSNEEMFHANPQIVLQWLKNSESEIKKLLDELIIVKNNSVNKEKTLASELTELKDANQKLVDDNQELRDLCCFLDDDRQKSRKLAKEWQRFGRYTAGVMRQEVSAYQNKLRELEMKQQELIRDNLEIKELCLYLDEERSRLAEACGISSLSHRDDGDGSSSSINQNDEIENVKSNTKNVEFINQQRIYEHNVQQELNDRSVQKQKSLFNEQRVTQLEEEKHHLYKNLKLSVSKFSQSKLTADDFPRNSDSLNTHLIETKPKALMEALKVLELQESLKSTCGKQDEHVLDEKETALLREMCNVVWKKLEENSGA